jgi:hypothetical protein
MSVSSDRWPNHLVHSVLCFPTGVRPEWIEGEPIAEDSRYEEYDIQYSDVPPQIGEVKTFDFDPSSSWVVVEVHQYSSSRSDLPVQAVYTAICTQTGEVATREDWGSGSPILYLSTTTDGALALNPDGSCDWGLTDEANHIPRQFGDLRRTDIQWFEPTQEIATQGFKAIALCWCEAAVKVAV